MLNIEPLFMGNEATDRASATAVNFTQIYRDNPASKTGKITSIEIFAATNISNLEVATFYLVSGSNYSTRDNETIGSVTAGSKQTFTVDLDVVAGDMIGLYATSGSLENDTSGGSGSLGAIGDCIPCTNQEFTSQGVDDAFSFCGRG